MLVLPSRVVFGCAVASLALAATRAHAFQSMMNAHGQGQSRASAWIFPNHPPATPNFDLPLQNSPSLNFGPFPSGDPRTHATVSGFGDFSWHLHGETRAATGDTIDWHSMLPFITPVSDDSSGAMDIVGAITSPTSATFTITWSATDAGTAMHVGWFEGGAELFETPIMVGPFSSTDVYTITSSGPIDLVMLETSMASTSTVPAPGALALLGLGLGVALRRSRRA
jgi:MYXO-CTERM domain-containing protein